MESFFEVKAAVTDFCGSVCANKSGIPLSTMKVTSFPLQGYVNANVIFLYGTLRNLFHPSKIYICKSLIINSLYLLHYIIKGY